MAGFSKDNSYLDALIENSADAQSNLYLLNIIAGTGLGEKEGIKDITEELQIRTESFDWTPPSQDQYEVKFLTAKINRPTAFVKVTHNFSFTVRVDAYYNVYKALLAQQNITFNPQEHRALNDINSDSIKTKLFDLKVSVITGATTSKQTSSKYLAGFEGCWITAIDPIAFKTGEPGPVKVKVSCAFKKLIDTNTQQSADWLGYKE
jgi:hypothetical protein